MYWLTSVVTGLVLACAQPVIASQIDLQGTWTAARAERDGKGADEVVGHRLSLAGDRFRIQSKDGKLLYAGTIRVDPRAKPAAIDFVRKEGVLNRKLWKGVYVLDGDTLTICDNAPNLAKGRPTAYRNPIHCNAFLEAALSIRQSQNKRICAG